jgi:hypothetical protein
MVVPEVVEQVVLDLMDKILVVVPVVLDYHIQLVEVQYHMLAVVVVLVVLVVLVEVLLELQHLVLDLQVHH